MRAAAIAKATASTRYSHWCRRGTRRRRLRTYRIDVGDKLGAPAGEEPTPAAAPTPGAAPPNSDVVAALVQLGWNEAIASRTVAAVESDGSAEGSEPSVPELLRASLRRLGGGGRG